MAGAGVILEPLLCQIGDIEMTLDDEQMPPPSQATSAWNL